MQNKRNVKIVAAGVVASAIAAGAIFAVQASETRQFSNDNLSTNDYAFMSHVSKCGKTYATKAEYKQRQANYERTEANIRAHNADPEATSTTAHNCYSDYTLQEWKNMKGYTGSNESQKHYATDLDGAPPADGIDWVQKGKVTPVQNQGQCGSCWTFSASGAISSARAIKLDQAPVDYSEQQIVDCDTTGNGCKGGLMDLAFTYVETHPLELSSDYPYKAVVGSCTYNAAEGTGAITSYKNVPVKKNEKGKIHPGPMKNALKKGPVSVGVAASSTAFGNYSGGILGKGCGTQLDHGILAVGWGKDQKGKEYLLVKNQWGATWGLNGFLKIDIHNGCGILSAASFPIV